MLDELGKICGTDKSSILHGYLDFYEELFALLKEKKIQLAEIGVLRGASIKLWEAYFTQATIWGLDRTLNKLRGEFSDRVHFIMGDQTDPAALAKINPGGVLDIVIDDGSHFPEHWTKTLDLLWPRVASNGIYIIEDIFYAHSAKVSPNGEKLIKDTLDKYAMPLTTNIAGIPTKRKSVCGVTQRETDVKRVILVPRLLVLIKK